MCLQWCHVTCTLIDNDLACAHCGPETRRAHAAERCDTCVHRQGVTCSLTREKLPGQRTCCHWGVPALAMGTVLTLTDANVAPGLLRYHQARDVAQLFDRSDTAPNYAGGGSQISVSLDDLAVPMVYGLPADEWDAALADDAGAARL